MSQQNLSHNISIYKIVPSHSRHAISLIKLSMANRATIHYKNEKKKKSTESELIHHQTHA